MLLNLIIILVRVSPSESTHASIFTDTLLMLVVNENKVIPPKGTSTSWLVHSLQCQTRIKHVCVELHIWKDVHYVSQILKSKLKTIKPAYVWRKTTKKLYRQIIPVGKGEIPGKFISIFSELFSMSIIILKIKTKE